MTVVMMGQISLDNSVEKSEKKNDQDQVDGMRQEVYYAIEKRVTHSLSIETNQYQQTGR